MTLPYIIKKLEEIGFYHGHHNYQKAESWFYEDEKQILFHSNNNKYFCLGLAGLSEKGDKIYLRFYIKNSNSLNLVKEGWYNHHNIFAYIKSFTDISLLKTIIKLLELIGFNQNLKNDKKTANPLLNNKKQIPFYSQSKNLAIELFDLDERKEKIYFRFYVKKSNNFNLVKEGWFNYNIFSGIKAWKEKNLGLSF